MVKQNKNIINYIQHIWKTSLHNKLQDISKTQNPSNRSFQGTRSEDRIVCKIRFVLTTNMLGLWNLQITYLNQWYDRIVLNKLRLSSILFSVWSSSSTFTNIMSMVVMPMSMPSPSYLIILASSSEEHHQKNILETVNPLLSLRPLPSNVYLRKNNTKYYTVESLKSGQLCRKLSRN